MEGKGKEMAKALPQEGKILLEKLSLHAQTHGFGGWGRGGGGVRGRRGEGRQKSNGIHKETTEVEVNWTLGGVTQL